MILSSADILRILGGSEIVRLSARLRISDGRPKLSGAEGLFIHIDRFPEIDEFEATWSIYIESDGSEPDDIIVNELKRLLPNVKVSEGLLLKVTTTDFRSESTQTAPVASQAPQASPAPNNYEERFQRLVEDVQDRMLLVNSGRNGRDGVDGRDGTPGRDGRDLIATDADLEDLGNVEEGLAKEKGQVLTWDGTKWTNLFVPQFSTPGAGGGGSGSGGGGIEEAPLDGNYYVRSNGAWLNLVHALDNLGYRRSNVLDGGDFTNGTTDAIDDAVLDGGDFTNEITDATDDAVLDGGDFS